MSRYGHMMKVPLGKVRMKVAMRFFLEGSVLRQAVRSGSVGVVTTLEVESGAPPEKLAGVIRNAENGCFTLQSLLIPVQAESRVTLNGKPFRLEDHPPPA